MVDLYELIKKRNEAKIQRDLAFQQYLETKRKREKQDIKKKIKGKVAAAANNELDPEKPDYKAMEAALSVPVKTIQAVVKEYKTDGQFMVESLIENLHREDLSPQEAYKFSKRIMDEENIRSTTELSKRLSIHEATIRNWFDSEELRKKLPKSIREKVSPTIISETKGLPEKQQIKNKNKNYSLWS